MTRYLGPDSGSAYVVFPDGRPAPGEVAEVFADVEGTVLADILAYQAGNPTVPGDPIDFVTTDPRGRLNFWFPDEQPVVWVSVNNGPLTRVTADLQDQLNDAIISGGGGGGITIGQVDARIAIHNADTTAVHGIADTAVLATDTDVAAAIAVHNALTTGVHGIADTSALETTVGAQAKADAAQGAATAAAASDATTKVATHAAAVDPHGDRAFATAGLATKADLVGGVVPTAQIPAIAITEFLGNTANQAAMLALSGQKGDWTIRTDTGSAWIITGNNPAVLADWTALPSAGAPVTSVNGQTGVVVLAKADVGLGNADNTTDASKPVSTATQTALDGKQPLDADLTTIAGLTATTDNILQSVAGAWASRTPAQVKTALAINNLDNTSDANKPVSSATQTALNLKANLASPAFTGTPSLPTGTTGVTQTAGNSSTALATTAFVTTADALKAPLAAPTFTGVPAAPTAAQGTNTTQIATTAYVQTEAGLLVPKSLVDAKGDLVTATADNTPARLAVGSNGQVLVADSAQATGLKYETRTQVLVLAAAAAVPGGTPTGTVIIRTP